MEANFRLEQHSSGWAEALRDGRVPVPSMPLEVALPHGRSLQEHWGWGKEAPGPLASFSETEQRPANTARQGILKSAG